jgi:hypothetical protein
MVSHPWILKQGPDEKGASRFLAAHRLLIVLDDFGRSHHFRHE